MAAAASAALAPAFEGGGRHDPVAGLRIRIGLPSKTRRHVFKSRLAYVP